MSKQKTTVEKHNQLVQDSLALIDQQVLSVVDNFPKLKLKKKGYQQVFVCGMGGSTLGADIMRYVFWKELKVPIVIVNNYNLPSSVNKKSLVILSSYSGSTEETNSCLKETITKKLPAIVLTAGGRLERVAVKHKIPVIKIDQSYNPSKQPRLGVGYTIGALLLTFKKLNILKVSLEEIEKAVVVMKKLGKLPVTEVKNDSVVIVASEHLIGTAHLMSNQLNETAKKFAPFYALPEMNHHLLESLDSLDKKKWTFVFLESDDYHKRVLRRYQITKAVVKKLGFKVVSKKVGGSKLEQALTIVNWSSYLSYELAKVNKLDATKIPWVDYFKKQLK